MRIFISHSSKDKTLANRFVRAIRATIDIGEKEIRCTSLPEYSLSVGSRVSRRLRQDIEGADVVVGLVTPMSLQSSYVLFELGAAWGKGKRTFPLLAKGVGMNRLPELMKEINCVSISDPDVARKVVSDLANALGLAMKPRDSAVDEAIDRLVRAAKRRRRKRYKKARRRRVGP